jgi:hypothetical protein
MQQKRFTKKTTHKKSDTDTQNNKKDFLIIYSFLYFIHKLTHKKTPQKNQAELR